MHNIFKISGNPEGFQDLDVFHKLAQQFLPYAQKKLQFDKPVDIQLLSDPQNAKDPLGKTAYYDPNQMKITLFVDKRHVKDILRSLAHELVHHRQNCRGEFAGGVDTSPGYAQEDGKMRKLEGEAYLEGSGYLMRDWEDNLKKENKVMAESTALQQEEENVVEENSDPHPGETEAQAKAPGGSHPGQSCAEAHAVAVKENTEAEKRRRLQADIKKYENRISKANSGEGRFANVSGETVAGWKKTLEKFQNQLGNLNENWFKGDKDQVLFERLMEKWTK